ncbi:MAG: hypothetical protein H7329_10730 [Opitutaceae bacterium]|nr:hypothetical protein [Cytophagales bacterium]
MAKIEYEIIGVSNFLTDAEYSFHIFNFIKDFEDKFLLAESITIHFEESINQNPNKPVLNVLTVSDDGRSIKLVHKSSRFSQPKGGMSKPSVSDFFSGLKFFMENTVIAGDHERFELLNNNQDE